MFLVAYSYEEFINKEQLFILQGLELLIANQAISWFAIITLHNLDTTARLFQPSKKNIPSFSSFQLKDKRKFSF